jgi:alpha-L-arabinofuranosidase
MKTPWLLIVILFVTSLVSAQTTLTIDLNNPGAPISPTHYGIFFEDINHAADGGLYAELVRNRSFEDATTPEYWLAISQVGASAAATIETSDLLNTSQSKALKLTIGKATSTARAGVLNKGFWGINVVKDRTYKLTFFAKRDTSFHGSLNVSLESSAGVQYAQASITELGTEWQKYSCTLVANDNDPSGVFVLSSYSSGTLWFDVVSLFPPTFKDRENGLRPELAQLLADMKPTFMRFPGGCFVEGDNLANRFQWKNTIGPIENRPGHYNLWKYRTSDGMGFHEFLQLAEDLGAAPLYVTNVGVAHSDFQSYTALTWYLQDVLDALEYANGDVSTTYGAMRAANGHPAPFHIQYLEIGNENYFNDNYGSRYIQFYNAVKAKYPQMKCIGNVAAWGTDSPTWTFTHPVDLLDEHYYRNPTWFINQYHKYDTYSRTGPKIYTGEYAVTSDCGLGNLSAAIGEAVYMAGMEKNSDVVTMNSYAPIFVNVNDRNWSPDMIDYSASSVYCTPSYYVQKLFANHIGTVNIPVEDTLNRKETVITGAVGLGSWLTQADYSNVLVESGLGATVFSDDFSSTSKWTPVTGSWSASGGVYSQTTTLENCRSIATVITDSVYTYSLKARKTGGGEGFLIIFGYQDADHFYWWNIGGWGNTQHAIEHCVNGSKAVLVSASGNIVTNQWYDVRIEVYKDKVLCYLNNVLIHTLLTEAPLLYTAASLDEQSKQLFVKVVNPTDKDVASRLDFVGLAHANIRGTATVLTSASPADENSLADPTKVAPISFPIDTVAPTHYTFKPNSVTILQLDASQSNALHPLRQSDAGFMIYPNPMKDQIFIKGAGLEDISVEIFNMLGQSVLMKRVSNAGNIHISGMNPGVYVVKAKTGTHFASVKMVKE